MTDKKIFHSIKTKYLRFNSKSKRFAKEEIEERKIILKKLLDKRAKKLNQREKLDITNQLSRKENLTIPTLMTIIELKENVKINNIKVKNLQKELMDIEKRRGEIKDDLDNTYYKIEIDTERCNKFIMKYS